LSTVSRDTARCWLMNDIAEELFGSQPDTSIVMWNKCLALVEKKLETEQDEKSRIVFLKCKAQVFKNIGFYNQSKNGAKKALEYFSRSLKISEELKDVGEIANSNTNIGGAYSSLGNVSLALTYYTKALKMLEKTGDPDDLAFCLVRMGNIYKDQKEGKEALRNFDRALGIYEKRNNKVGTALAIAQISWVYNELGDPYCSLSEAECLEASRTKALKGYLRALGIWQETENKVGVGAAANNIASIYKASGQPEEALKYIKLSLEASEEVGHKQGILSAWREYGEVAFMQGNIKEAKKYALNSLQMAKELGYPEKIRDAAGLLNRIYKAEHNYKAAMEMNELHVLMRDSITNESTRKVSIRNQLQLEYEKQVEKDSILNAERIREEHFRNEQAISEQRVYTYAGITGFALMLVVALISFRAYRAKQKANWLITRQNEQIETNNKDLERQHLLNQKIFSVISHDFRGPILSLNLVLDKFKKSSEDPKLNKYLQDTGTAVRNANEVLNSLLNWAKTEINISGLDKTESTIQAVMTEIKNELAGKLEEKQLSIEERIPVDAIIALPPNILRITLRNLLSNAIKFSYAGNKIEIAFTENKILSVRDFGAGMPADIAAQLFRQQVNPEIGTNREEGFGIGLYIVSELLYKYNYTISTESKPGAGTSFFITPNV
jgi:signal transduction histidine kinase